MGGSMSLGHVANISIHVIFGALAIALGFVILFKTKGTPTHKRLGRYFVFLTSIVCATAIVGTLFFRYIPVFAVLSVLVPYQLLSGWYTVRKQSKEPSRLDAMLTLVAMVFLMVLAPKVLASHAMVAFSSLGALATILLYDSARWIFPKRWHLVLWKYEHVYKMNASLFGMLSAFVGNVVRMGQPWSQLMPSAAGLLVILFFFLKLGRHNEEAPLARPSPESSDAVST